MAIWDGITFEVLMDKTEDERFQTHKRLPSFEAFDCIELKVVPRFKDSGLSGSVWRTSVTARFFFKKELVHETHYLDMQAALMMLPHDWITAQEPIPSEVCHQEKVMCDQPGCYNMHNGDKRYLKRETAADGSFLEGNYPLVSYRRFCGAHEERGTASREDSDSNYTMLLEDVPMSAEKSTVAVPERAFYDRLIKMKKVRLLAPEVAMERLKANVDSSPEFVNKLYPLLVRDPGEEVNAFSLVMHISMALHTYTTHKPPMVLGLLQRHVGAFCRALVDDEEVIRDLQYVLTGDTADCTAQQVTE